MLQNPTTLREHRKKHLLLALPVMVAQLGQISVSVADTIMVGRLGATPLAAVGYSNSMQAVFVLFGIGVSFGLTPLVAAADGENDQARSWYVLRHGRVVCLMAGLLLALLGLGLVPFMPYMDQPPSVVALSQPYFLVLAASWLPLMGFQAYRQFTEGLSYTRQAMQIAVSGNLLNVALNWVLIYGKLGLPELGLMGAGYATLISRVFMALAMWGYVQFHGRFASYRNAEQHSPITKRGILEILRIGLPSGVQYIFEVSAFTATAVMMGWLGVFTQAAHQIVINVSAITYLMASGLASATSIRVGNQLGRRDYTTLRLVGWVGNRIATVFMIFWALIFILFQDQIPLLYTDDPNVIPIAASLLVVSAIFQLPDGIQVVSLGALRGMRDVKLPTYITLMAYWVLGIPSGYILGFVFDLGPTGVWTGLIVGLSVAAILLAFRFHRLSRRLIQNFAANESA